MRKIDKTKYLAVFSISTLIFISGVIASQYINEMRTNDFISAQRDLKNYILSLNLQTELAKKYECEVNIYELGREKNVLGNQIFVLENKMGRDDEEIKSLKEEYSLISIRQWLLFEEIKKNCDEKIINIVYFYSNNQNEALCQSQGFILDYLYRKYPNNVFIYALDYDINSPAINTFKEVHGITQVPSINIDGKTYYGFQDKGILEKIIIEKMNN